MIAEDGLRMIAVHTVPIWEDPEAPSRYRPPMPGEERSDLNVVGFGNVAVIQGLENYGVKRWLLLVGKDGQVVYDEPPVGEF